MSIEFRAKSIRSFIGSKNFALSKSFYEELGFTGNTISADLVYFAISENVGFYLQDYYVEEWVNNTMIFLEVEDVTAFYTQIKSLELPLKYNGVKLMPIKEETWGRECFLIDPAGVLWHIGEFKVPAY